MVRPPRHAQGGMADPFGNSGAPGMPPDSEGAKRAHDEMVQRYELARGRFLERVFVFPSFDPLNAATPSNQQSIDVKSNGDSFVRLVAFRGVVDTSDAVYSGAERLRTFLNMQIDGLEDFCTSGRQTQPASIAALFADESAPWFWFSAPPLLRVGETIAATMQAAPPPAGGEGQSWLPQLVLRLVDDETWCQLYGS